MILFLLWPMLRKPLEGRRGIRVLLACLCLLEMVVEIALLYLFVFPHVPADLFDGAAIGSGGVE